jgi:hypothetical protein
MCVVVSTLTVLGALPGAVTPKIQWNHSVQNFFMRVEATGHWPVFRPGKTHFQRRNPIVELRY